MKEIYINLKEQDEYFVWKWLQKKHKKDLVSIDELISDIEDLICDVEHLEELLEKGE